MSQPWHSTAETILEQLRTDPPYLGGIDGRVPDPGHYMESIKEAKQILDETGSANADLIGFLIAVEPVLVKNVYLYLRSTIIERATDDVKALLGWPKRPIWQRLCDKGKKGSRG